MLRNPYSRRYVFDRQKSAVRFHRFTVFPNCFSNAFSMDINIAVVEIVAFFLLSFSAKANFLHARNKGTLAPKITVQNISSSNIKPDGEQVLSCRYLRQMKAGYACSFDNLWLYLLSTPDQNVLHCASVLTGRLDMRTIGVLPKSVLILEYPV